jgi:hypothetical protein
MGTTYHNKPIVTDGLVFYVDPANKESYPGSGTEITDLINSNITGSFENEAGFNENNGGSFFSNGTSQTYINSGLPTASLEINKITVSQWFFCEGGTTSRNSQQLYNFANGNNGVFTEFINQFGNWYVYWAIADASAFPDNDLRISIKPSGGSEQYVFSNQWNQIVLTLDLTQADSDKANVYANGDLVPFDSGYSALTVSTLGSGSMLSIGGDRKSSNAAISFSGSLGPFQIYNKALSASEVLQNYNALKNRFI